MNEEKPKSFWKKSLPLPGSFLGWLVLVTGLALAFSLLGALIVDGAQWMKDFDVIWIIVAISVVAAVLFSFIRWLCCWRNFKRFLFGFACFVTLIALFYAEENWRGKHDWEKFKREWAAKGERFDWQSIVPPPVPDDQNFAFSPVWIAEIRYGFLSEERTKAWYGNRIYSQEVSNFVSQIPVSVSTIVGTNMWRFPQPPENSGTWASSRFLDLKPLQSYYRNWGKTNSVTEIIIAPQPQSPAQDVLLALSKFGPVIEQLREDNAKPYSRFPIQYDGMPAAILLPHLAALKSTANVLQLHAVAELQSGQSKRTLADVKLMLRLANASRNEPFLICHLVRIAILNLIMQPIWEGLANHQWSDAQLADLDSELAKLDFPVDFKSSIHSTTAFEIADIEYVQRPHDLGSQRPLWSFIAPIFYILHGWSNMGESRDSDPSRFQMFALALEPSGWLDQNKLRLAQFNIKWYLPVIDEETKTISPAKMRAAYAAQKKEIRHRTPESALAAAFVPDWNNAAEKFAHAQSSTDLARVAMALERYRLAHGEFPESLDALAPKFISKVPHDVIGGGPLKYRRAADGQFVLYSVGWNERDDGGVTVISKGGSQPRFEEGDWVWRYPAK